MRIIKTLPACFLACLLTLPATAQQAWWPTSDGSADTDDNNYSVVNIGQLKNMVAHTVLHFRNQGIAVPASVTEMLETWRNNEEANNHLTANIGQLKHVSKPFWDVLIAQNLKTQSDLPWTAETDDDQNKALVTIGQLKTVFNFNIRTLVEESQDTDADGIPDAWEQYLINFSDTDGITNLSQINATSDFDGDLLLDYDEFRLTTDPTDKDTDADGLLDGNEPPASADPLQMDHPEVELIVL